MGKGSGMLARMKAQHQAELEAQRIATRQETADFFLAAVHQEFGFGPKRQARLMARVNALIIEECEISADDTRDRQYTIEKHEEMMRQTCGKGYVPREERYGYD